MHGEHHKARARRARCVDDCATGATRSHCRDRREAPRAGGCRAKRGSYLCCWHSSAAEVLRLLLLRRLLLLELVLSTSALCRATTPAAPSAPTTRTFTFVMYRLAQAATVTTVRHAAPVFFGRLAVAPLVLTAALLPHVDLTGTTTSPDGFKADVWGVIRMWRSPSLAPGSFTGGHVVYNISSDCSFCGSATEPGSCRLPNIRGQCNGMGKDGKPGGHCALVWAPEFHHLPKKATDVPGSGGYFLTFHFHCAGGGSGVLRSTSGHAFGPYADLVHGVPGGDVTLFQDPHDQQVYTISSGPYSACLLNPNMTNIARCFRLGSASWNASSVAWNADGSPIGFEGPFMVAIRNQSSSSGYTYFLSGSAFGNATGDDGRHGGPDYCSGPDCLYSTYTASASSLRGNFSVAWLSVAGGGHNVFFRGSGGQLYSTIWYGSERKGALPAADRGLVDLPSIVKCGIDASSKSLRCPTGVTGGE
eukprot:COSAG02_NODE_10074_length_2032_cov_3.760476_1_plen_475_part_00